MCYAINLPCQQMFETLDSFCKFTTSCAHIAQRLTFRGGSIDSRARGSIRYFN
jgi:hypothetical protein